MAFPHISNDLLYLIGLKVTEQRAVVTIQRKYRDYYVNKVYEQGMINEGYIKLMCGVWTNGAQCMCDICMGY